MSVLSYYDQFNNIIDMLDHYGVSLGEDEGIMNKVLENNSIPVLMATVMQ